MEEELKDIFQSVFNRDFTMDQFRELSMQSYSSWDSLRHVELILKIQKQYNLSISLQYIEEMKSVQNILRILNVDS